MAEHASGETGNTGAFPSLEGEAGLTVNRGPSRERVAELAGREPLIQIDGLVAGYGKMEILHGVDLQVGAGQSLCLIGPNGAGKSTVLHSIYGFTNIMDGAITVQGSDITRLSPDEKLKTAGIAYVLQDNSIFPDMSVEENLWMGGFLMDTPGEAKEAAERIFREYPRLAERRRLRAGILSGGERRLLEIARALVMEPRRRVWSSRTSGMSSSRARSRWPREATPSSETPRWAVFSWAASMRRRHSGPAPTLDTKFPLPP